MRAVIERPPAAGAQTPHLTPLHAHPVLVAARRVLVYTHRWLGIVGGVLILLWLVSGVMMMYARMPRLSAEERLRYAGALDLTTARLEPAVAARGVGGPPERLRVGMLGARPVYRVHDGRRWQTIFADDGERLETLGAALALDVARRVAPADGLNPHVVARLTEPDQWTLQIRGLLPV